MNGLIEWVLFLSLSAIAIITAAGMILTMSMYRAGLALMASFVALAGLFILLNADLLAAIQVMMNVGGMLAMVLFMVMMMMDPGGEMMWGMKRDMHMPGPAAFSMHMPRGKPPEEQPAPQKEGQVTGMTPRQYYDMMVDMAMSTAQLPWALVLGAATALLLIVLVIQTPWPLSTVGPTQDATNAVGELLLSRYMIGFEGAAFLILAGIAGAVLLAKRESVPEPQSQTKHDESAEAHNGTVYTCPMHPEVRESHPGNCPKCGMNLIPVEEIADSSRQSKEGGHS